MIKVNGLSVSRIPINGKETLRVMKNSQQLWSGTGLPAGYTPLEYIESTGQQYIDTGVKLSPSLSAFVDFQFTKTDSDKWCFSILEQATGARWSAGIFQGSFYLENMEASQSNLTSRTQFTGSAIASSSYTIHLFAQNLNGSPYGYGSGKMYSCKIYDNGNLVRDYIPCKNPSGIYGLYDKIGRKFYKSATSTGFNGA